MIGTTNKIRYYGFAFAVCAAFLYALSALVGKKITDDFSSPMVASAFSILFGLVATGSVFFGTVNEEARNLAGRSWVLIGLSGCASALGVTGWYLALNITPVVVVAPIVAVYPLVTIAIASLFLRGIEKVTRQTVIGAVIVVTGVLLIGLGTQ
ncbi:MAG: EamA family transporter [Chloroflexota bacterium]|nr:EamA family transporter [Chloroflexota bacterium]